MPVGTFGKIGFIDQSNARSEFVHAFVTTTVASAWCRRPNERALKTELADRTTPGGSAITSATRMDVLADARLAAAHDWSTGTERTYRSVIKRSRLSRPSASCVCARPLPAW